MPPPLLPLLFSEGIKDTGINAASAGVAAPLVPITKIASRQPTTISPTVGVLKFITGVGIVRNCRLVFSCCRIESNAGTDLGISTGCNCS